MESKFPRKVTKPWGYELLWAGTSRYAGKLIFIREGHRLSLQHHKVKDESMYLYAGKARIEIEGSDGKLVSSLAEPGYCVHVPPLTKHRIEALEDTTLFEVSTSELDDVVRFSDDYGRAD